MASYDPPCLSTREHDLATSDQEYTQYPVLKRKKKKNPTTIIMLLDPAGLLLTPEKQAIGKPI